MPDGPTATLGHRNHIRLRACRLGFWQTRRLSGRGTVRSFLKITSLACLTVLCGGLCGCATHLTTTKLACYTTIETEFTKSFRRLSPNDSVEGSYLGRTNVGGITYEHYQFPGVLTHKGNRTLHVMVPFSAASDSSPAVVTEGSIWPASIAPARLYVVHVGYASYMNGSVPAEFSEHCLRWFPPSEAGCVSLLLEQPGRSPEWKDYPATVHLPWHRRNVAGVCGWGLCYLVAVPIDIVTFPIQLVVYFTVPRA